MEEPHALIERRGHVLIVTMNRPAGAQRAERRR